MNQGSKTGGNNLYLTNHDEEDDETQQRSRYHHTDYHSIPKSNDIGALFSVLAELCATTSVDLSDIPDDPFIVELNAECKRYVNDQRVAEEQSVGGDAILYTKSADGMQDRPSKRRRVHADSPSLSSGDAAHTDTNTNEPLTQNEMRNLVGSYVDPLNYEREFRTKFSSNRSSARRGPMVGLSSPARKRSSLNKFNNNSSYLHIYVRHTSQYPGRHVEIELNFCSSYTQRKGIVRFGQCTLTHHNTRKDDRDDFCR